MTTKTKTICGTERLSHRKQIRSIANLTTTTTPNIKPLANLVEIVLIVSYYIIEMYFVNKDDKDIII